MDRISSILVVVDPTASDQPAVKKASMVAVQLQASVELLACETKASYELRVAKTLVELPTRVPTMNLQPWLDSLAAPLRERGIDVTTSLIAGDPLHETLLKWLQNSPADLVIKDTHHHSLARRTFIGNTDWHLIRDCALPLLLTKPTHWHREPALAAALDPPEIINCEQEFLDRCILDCTLLLGHAMKGKVHAMHAYFPAIVAASANSPNFLSVTPEMLAAEKQLHLTKLRSLVAPYKIPDECLHVDMEVPIEYLPRAAEQYEIDIMVMGAISRSHLKQTIIGSTAERLLEYLPCDVLLVKAAKFGECLPF